MPILLIVGGVIAFAAAALWARGDTVPNHQPDYVLTPTDSGKTGYRLVDALLPALRAASQASQIPLGVLVAWIAKESGGKLTSTTKYDERGLFQIMPAESKSLGIDHVRLSTDATYSINMGLVLIGKYMHEADALGIAPRGSSYYWRLVKLCHSMGTGAVKWIVDHARANNAVGSWEDLERFALDHNAEILHVVKHAPAKWMSFCDEIYRLGAPFGFGTEQTHMVGGDIPDVLDVIL